VLLELGMDRLPASSPAVVQADVSARKDNEKKNPIERNETGFLLWAEGELVSNIALKTGRARKVTPCGEQDMMILREIDDGADVEPEAVVAVVRIGRLVDQLAAKGQDL
jgi:hypothetical protein